VQQRKQPAVHPCGVVAQHAQLLAHAPQRAPRDPPHGALDGRRAGRAQRVFHVVQHVLGVVQLVLQVVLPRVKLLYLVVVGVAQLLQVRL